MKNNIFDEFDPNALSFSFNYQFCFLGLKGIYFYSQYDFSTLCGSHKSIEFLLTKAIEAVIKHKHLPFDESFGKLSYQYKFINDQPTVLIILPKKEYIECECNFILLTEDKNKEKVIYTSEYYAMDNEFKLCEVRKDSRGSLSYITNTKEEFINAVSEVLK